MKIVVFDVRKQEIDYYARWEHQLGIELQLHESPLTADTVAEVVGADAVLVLNSKINAGLAAQLVDRGVLFLATRSIGYDTIDVAGANAAGLRVAHSAYAPNAVAEFTVMLLLMAVRKAQQMLRRAAIQDYSIDGQMGGQLSEMTVGIIGGGSIGSTVAKLLQPFGCRLLVRDSFHNPKLDGMVEFVDLDTLLEQSDAITLHAPALPATHHLIDAPQFAKMRDGVVLVNAARGDLINPSALIAAIESGKVGAAALDALVDDLSYYHKDRRLTLIDNHDMALLAWYPNVILTPHMAFYTDTVMSEMIGNSLTALRDLVANGESKLEVRP